MGGIEKDHEINEIVKDIIADFDGGRNIDAKKLFNNPDKTEVIELVQHFFRIIYFFHNFMVTYVTAFAKRNR